MYGFIIGNYQQLIIVMMLRKSDFEFMVRRFNDDVPRFDSRQIYD